MADPRIIAIALDEDTIQSRNAEIGRELMVAVADLIAGNHFAPTRPKARGFDGPYRVTLRVQDGRLAIDIADADSQALETIILGLARFRRPIRDYFAMCQSYYRALDNAQPAQIETIDMARRGIHNEAAELLTECLAGKAEIDFDTARRLFTLVAALHIRG